VITQGCAGPLLRRESKYLLHRGIHVCEAHVEVHTPNDVHGIVGNHAVALLTLTQGGIRPLLLSDVARYRLRRHQSTLCIPPRHGGTHTVHLRAVNFPQPHLLIDYRPITIQTSQELITIRRIDIHR